MRPLTQSRQEEQTGRQNLPGKKKSAVSASSKQSLGSRIPAPLAHRHTTAYWIKHCGLFLSAGHALLGLQKRVYIALVDQCRPSIHERWDRRKTVLRPVGVERRRLVVIQVVEHVHADKGHVVGLLGDGSGDAAS